jgi:predicted dehydrogenase
MTVGFGVIGSGHMGSVYAAALAGAAPGAAPVARLVAVAGGSRAAGLGAAHGVPAVAVEALLERPDVDAVVIATPHSTHLPLAASAAAAGKHVFLEKPMARTVAECDAIIAACEQADVLLTVGKVSRWFEASRVGHDLVRSGAVGAVRMIQGWRLRADIRLEIAGDKSWTHDPAEGSAFLDWGTHGADLLRWFSGAEPELAHGMFTSFRAGQTVHASGMAQYRFAGPVLTHLWMSYEVAATLGARTRYLIAGDDATLEVHPFGRVALHRGTETRVVFERPGFGGPDAPADERLPYFSDAFRDQVLQFASAVSGQEVLSVTGQDGRVAVAMVEAAERSSIDGTAVPIPGP